MNQNPDSSQPTLQADQHAALFANLILQQSNMAMLLMGRVTHPGADKPIKDLEAARLFIDQLEMLEAKTKGNLSREEEGLLKQTLMALRLEYVEAVEHGDEGAKPQEKVPAPAQSESPTSASPESKSPGDESHKKFSKKY